MAEEELHYASIVFKNKNSSRSEVKKEEETVYDQVKVRNDGQTELVPDKKADGRSFQYQHLACLGTFCVILLLGIIAFVIYIATLNHDVTQLEELKHNQTVLTTQNENLKRDNKNLTAGNQNLQVKNLQLEALNDNLTDINTNLTTENENLKRDNRNLTQAYIVLGNKVTNLTAGNQNLQLKNQQLEALNDNLTDINTNLTTENENLKRDNRNLTQAYIVLDNKVTNLTAGNQNLQIQNQQLETDKKNLTAQLQNMEKAEMALNISRAQWTYDQYCRINTGGMCQGCQNGWLPSGSNCYAVNNPPPVNQTSWEAAREDCRGKISDLVVVVNGNEKDYVREKSWHIDGVNPGYWLGLRVKDGKWKWVDGSNLTDLSWIQQLPATEGQCAISVPSNGWKSVSCNEKKGWMCKKKGLTL
ncbi:C-type lectin domain family 10 member A-like isoform X6 [Parambassis ranga]|uniref:C-type lectin domain family 10 member A-like isoform X6 n=1 Tax=Parambassis ranga TaxID=210632 RepID=A0A6P7JZG7_9TELE|nr:C-type lectin domain family 10 member A-like isoform X6 [Parambassis ranga]